MGKRSLLLLTLIFLLTGISAKAQPGDAVDAIAGHLKAADAAKVATYFASAVEFTINSDEGTYSRAQAEQVIRDFFLNHRPVTVKIIHRLNSNPNFRLAVLSLSTSKEKYRVSISLSSNGQQFQIKEMRIELDKQ